VKAFDSISKKLGIIDIKKGRFMDE